MKRERQKFGKEVILFALLFAMLAFAIVECASGTTPPAEEWNRTFGGPAEDCAYSVQQTADGGYILVGETNSYGAGLGDFWLLKTNSNGNKEWEKTFGGSKFDVARSVQQTADGGYILAGYTGSYGAGVQDFWLVKTDLSGNEEWNNTFGGPDDDRAYSVQQTADGRYILAGYTRSYGAGLSDFWLVKTDLSGNEEWNNTFGGPWGDPWSETADSVQQTTDGGYILAGDTMSYGAGAQDFWLVKTDLSGNEEWNNTFGGPYSDFAHSVQQTTDGGYVLAGTIGISDFWLVKTDSNGNKEWDKTFGGPCGEPWGETAYSVQQTTDGGYILAGYTACGHCDVLLVKTDSNGNMEWNKTFGGPETDWAHSVQQTSDGGYILAGYTRSYGAGGSDFWLIKVKGEPEENQPPTANFTCSPKNPIVNQIITFNASNSTDPDGTVVKYEWVFGDGDTATGKIVTHSYSSEGSYVVSLTITDDDGATDSSSIDLFVFDEPDLGFKPNPHGYQFENFGGVKSWAMFEQFFGKDAVRYSNGDKIYIAEQYFKKYRQHQDGSCDGFSATSLINFKHLEQPNAGPFAMPYYPKLYNVGYCDLTIGSAIFYQQGFWWSYEIQNHVSDLSKDLQNSPKLYYEELKQEIQRGNPVILSIFTLDIVDSKVKEGGHSIVPYRIEEPSKDEAYVYVYDPNCPGDDNRKVIFDLKNDRWSYVRNGKTWEGQKYKKYHHMTIVPLSMRLRKGVAPWIQAWLGFANLVSSTGPTSLLFTDERGRRFGIVDDQFVNEIPGAINIVPPMGGDAPFKFYYLPEIVEYTATISGTGEGIMSLDTFSDQSLIEFTTVVHSSTDDTLIIGGGSRSVTYSTNDDYKEYSVTIDKELADTGRIVSVDTSISQGDTVTLELTDEHSFKYVNIGNQKSYDLVLEQRGEGAGRTSFSGLTVGHNDTHIIKVIDWDNLDTTEIVLEIDKDSDGTMDVTVVLPELIGINVNKVANPPDVAPSSNVEFTITVSNIGDCIHDPVRVVDTLSWWMSYVSSSPTADTHDGTIIWNNVGPLDPGSSKTITLVARIASDASGTLTNAVTVTGTSPTGEEVTDSDTVTVTVLAKTIEPSTQTLIDVTTEIKSDGIVIEGEQFGWMTGNGNLFNNPPLAPGEAVGSIKYDDKMIGSNGTTEFTKNFGVNTNVTPNIAVTKDIGYTSGDLGSLSYTEQVGMRYYGASPPLSKNTKCEDVNAYSKMVVTDVDAASETEVGITETEERDLRYGMNVEGKGSVSAGVDASTSSMSYKDKSTAYGGNFSLHKKVDYTSKPSTSITTDLKGDSTVVEEGQFRGESGNKNLKYDDKMIGSNGTAEFAKCVDASTTNLEVDKSIGYKSGDLGSLSYDEQVGMRYSSNAKCEDVNAYGKMVATNATTETDVEITGRSLYYGIDAEGNGSVAAGVDMSAEGGRTDMTYVDKSNAYGNFTFEKEIGYKSNPP